MQLAVTFKVKYYKKDPESSSDIRFLSTDALKIIHKLILLFC